MNQREGNCRLQRIKKSAKQSKPLEHAYNKKRVSQTILIKNLGAMTNSMDWLVTEIDNQMKSTEKSDPCEIKALPEHLFEATNSLDKFKEMMLNMMHQK